MPIRTPVVALLTFVTLAGCIERKETIKVGADGAVDVLVEHHTESHEEMYLGDAVPTLEGGWLVERWTEIDEDGDEHFHLKAEAGFPAGTALPASYAAPTDPAPELSLSFPTTLLIEERGDGVYFHFRRVYQSRRWAYVQVLRERIEEGLEEIKDRDWSELSPDERRDLLNGMIMFERQKHAAIARLAFEDAAPDAPQDAWLAVSAAIMDMPVDIEHVLMLMGDGDNVDEKAIEQIGVDFENGMREFAGRAMREHAQGAGRVNEFVSRFRHHLRYYEITEELADDKFEIIVEMPGMITGHNADEITGAQVTWNFGGEHVRDRDLELMVTSRIAWE